MTEQEQPVPQVKIFANKTRKVVLAVLGVVLLAGLLAGGYKLAHRPASPRPPAYSPYNQELVALEHQTPPDDPMQRAIYYGQIGQAYGNLHNWDKALQNYLSAQRIIDDHKLNDQFVFYQAIADTYLAENDTQHAKVYLQKQLDYLEAYLKAHPDDVASPNAIKTVQAKLRTL